MLASELIQQLQETIEKHGDLPVWVFMEYFDVPTEQEFEVCEESEKDKDGYGKIKPKRIVI